MSLLPEQQQQPPKSACHGSPPARPLFLQTRQQPGVYGNKHAANDLSSPRLSKSINTFQHAGSVRYKTEMKINERSKDDQSFPFLFMDCLTILPALPHIMILHYTHYIELPQQLGPTSNNPFVPDKAVNKQCMSLKKNLKKSCTNRPKLTSS